MKDLWEQHAARELRALVRSAGVGYSELAEALVRQGEVLTAGSLTKKVYRGSFSFSFYLKCRAVVNELAVSRATIPAFTSLVEHPKPGTPAHGKC